MITEIIKTLHSNEFYGAGEFTEIAKGKNKKISTLKECKYKIRRIWRSKKK